MKRIIPIALFFALMLSSCIIGKSKVLEPLSAYPDNVSMRIPSGTLKVSSIFIPEVGSLMRGAKSVELFTCDDKESMPEISEQLLDIVNSHGMELYVEVRDSDEIVDVYGLASDKDGILKEAIVSVSDPEGCAIVFLKGKIDIASFINEVSTEKEGRQVNLN